MLELLINGSKRTVECSPEKPLLWVLREELQLTGTKFGCGVGVCGACTVHLDGVAVRSCVLPVGDVGNSPVTTIEGLAAHSLHPVQAAWVEHDVPQCGYCQPGFVMAAAALLARERHADEATVRTQLTNLCRCGTYSRILAAILDVAGGRHDA